MFECFDAIGPGVVVVVEEILECGGPPATDVCTYPDIGSSFLARTNPYGLPDDPVFWSTTYLRTYLVAEFGWDFVTGANGGLFHEGLLWDGSLLLAECSTMLSVAEVILSLPSLCHNSTLTSIASSLPAGDCEPPPLSTSCQNGLCTGPPVVSCQFFDCDYDSDTICDGGGGGSPGDFPCTGGDTTDCDDNCRFTSNPTQADPDGDGIGSACDNCPANYNFQQTDTDFDGMGDVCDLDDDNDGLLDSVETNTGTFIDPSNTGTNPLIADTDGDGFSDGLEVQAGSNPNSGGDTPPDTDVDGRVDVQDNCTQVANANQLDVNHEGFGNICDADITDDGVVGLTDWLLFSGGCYAKMVGPGACSCGGCGCVHDPTCAESDFTGDGVVGLSDYLILGMSYNLPPGPSGLSCAGSVPCPP